MKMKKYILLLSVVLLSGCLSPVKTEPTASYVVNAMPRHAPTSREHAGVLMVLAPDARPIYQTTRMAYINRPYQIQYFAENEWAETPAQMLQPLLTQALENTNRFRAVVTPPYVGQYNYFLSMQILRFDQDYLLRPRSFKMVLRVNLNRATGGNLIASKEFSIAVPLSCATPYAGVVAANVAARQLLKDIAGFVVEKT